MVTFEMRVDTVVKSFNLLPGELKKGLKNGMLTVAKRYRQEHKKARLRAPPPPKFHGRSTGPGVHGTMKTLATAAGGKLGAGFLSTQWLKTDITGDSLDALQMRMFIVGGLVKTHEYGRKSTRRMLLPMAASKNSIGRLTSGAKNLLRKGMHQLQAQSEGMRLVNSRGKPKAGQLFKIVRAKDGKVFYALRRAGKILFYFHEAKQATWHPKLGYYGEWEKWRKSAAVQQIFLNGLRFALQAIVAKRAAP